MSTVKANNVQVGQSGTATNNFTLYQPSTPDGTVRLAVGNSGATTGDVLSVSSTGLSVTGTLTSTGVNTFPAGSASAPSITTTGDTNTGVFFPAADTAAITTGGTERVRIDSIGNVGIGVTPSVWASSFKALEVTGGAIGGITTNQIDVVQNAYYNSSFKYKTTGAASLYQQAGTGHGFYSAASGSADASISWTQILGLDKDKSVALQGAAAQAGTGITFPATQSASTDPNTLDDYEEGSYTPTDSSGASLSFTNAYGYYTKVGRLVTYNFAVTYPSTASGSNAKISLPFTQSSGMNANASTGGFMFYVNTATTSTIMPIIGSGGSSLDMLFQSSMFNVTNANLSGKILRGMVIFYT